VELGGAGKKHICEFILALTESGAKPDARSRQTCLNRKAHAVGMTNPDHIPLACYRAWFSVGDPVMPEGKQAACQKLPQRVA